MKLSLEATPQELEEKSGDLLKALTEIIGPVAPDVVEALAKALPRKEPALKFPVLRELQKRTEALYDKMVESMLKDIGAVLDRGVEKSEDVEKALYIGPRGGRWADAAHTIPYDEKKHGKGKAEAEKKETWKITSIEDTREIDFDIGKRIPGSGQESECSRCGKFHEINYHMRSSGGKTAVVGSGCGPKLAGGAEMIDKASLKAARDKVREQEREAAQQQVDRWIDKIWEQLDTLDTPRLVMTKEIPEYPRPGYEDVEYPIIRTDDGLAEVAMNETGRRPIDYREQVMSEVEYRWIDTKIRQAMKDLEIEVKNRAFKWGLPFEEKRRHAQISLDQYITSELRRRMNKKFEDKISNIDNLDLDMVKAKVEHQDHTKAIAAHDDIAYRRVKQVLIGKGYTAEDFNNGGPLYGWSTNQLIDLARDKRAG